MEEYLDDYVNGNMFEDTLELIAEQKDRALVWHQAFDSYLMVNFWKFTEYIHPDGQPTKDDLYDLLREGYWFANKKLEEYIAREYNKER